MSPTLPAIFIALDYPDAASALAFAERVRGQPVGMKVGLELFVSSGPSVVEKLAALGFPVFLDLKLHDIPNTVSKTVEAIASLPVHCFTVHLSGGREMLEGVQFALERKRSPARALGVSVLTSFSQGAWSDLNRRISGAFTEIGSSVLGLAELAEDCGLFGLVCSPLELKAIRAERLKLKAVVPGIRPLGSDQGDQARATTPLEAIQSGADALVIGRPITRAKDPQAALVSVLSEISGKGTRL